MRYSPEILPLFYQIAWEHQLTNVCVAVRPRRFCTIGQRRYPLSRVPYMADKGAHLFVQADVAQNGGKSRRQEREVDSLNEAAELVKELNKHTKMHHAVISNGPPRSKSHFYYFISEWQKKEAIRRNGKRLPAPFKNHRDRPRG